VIRIDAIWMSTEPLDMKVLVHDGFGLWLAARRLNRGRFAWGAHAHEQPDRRAAAAPLVTGLVSTCPR